ncbi:divergent protein kinase domain 1C [Bactrocera dorsalis]|uniref:Divergent protein kinase domain 1C n=1 Tax=Bactrocera dorsalis TaxID=27457 RepID=A0ABM3JV26_BACDO|nr:divergent protein kinase domain 1C [Bactrocera dorsalis]
MMYPCMRMTRALRNLYHCVLLFLLVIPIGIGVFTLFCGSYVAHSVIPTICESYSQNHTNGPLCEEFCTKPSVFSDFHCIRGIPYAFTAEKNGNVYDFQLVAESLDDLTWRDKNGVNVYPKSADLYHMVKMHLLVNYNVTLEDNVLKRLINNEVDENEPTQIKDFWNLFNDNDYVMTKLFEDEAILPTMLGTCGSMFVTEHLHTPFEIRNGLTHKHLNFQTMYEYVLRLDMLNPDPVKICKMRLDYFGLSADHRVKVRNARYIMLESQLLKELASGKSCWYDTDCHWFDCIGSCVKNKCMNPPRQNNVQQLCQYVHMNPEQFRYFRAQDEMRILYEYVCKRKYRQNYW